MAILSELQPRHRTLRKVVLPVLLLAILRPDGLIGDTASQAITDVDTSSTTLAIGEPKEITSNSVNQISLPSSEHPDTTLPRSKKTPAKTPHVATATTSAPRPRTTSTTVFRRQETSTSNATTSTPIQEVKKGVDSTSELPDDPNIPAEYAAELSKKTVFLKGTSCSGSAITKGEVTIGVLTNLNCGFNETQVTRYRGSDNQLYTVRPGEAIQAQFGNSFNDINTLGPVTSIFVPKTGGGNQAVILGLNGNSAIDALNNYKYRTPEQISSAIKSGNTTIYFSGWSNNRASFALNALGTDTKDGLKVLWTVGKKNAAGAECGKGGEGAAGYAEVKTTGPDGKEISELIPVGPLAFYESLKPSPSRTEDQVNTVIKYYERLFNTKISGDYLCGFNVTAPSLTNRAEYIIVPSNEQVPGHIDNLLEATRKNFLDPNYNRTVVEGIARITIRDTAGKPTGEYQWFDRPTVFVEQESQKLLIAVENPNAKDSVEIRLLPTNADILPFSGPNRTEARMTNVKGRVEKAPGGGFKVGSIVISQPIEAPAANNFGKSYAIAPVGSELRLSPIPSDGRGGFGG